MNILLVDDCGMMRRFQKKVLADLGNVQFLEARDGVEALETIATCGPFDLVLVDWSMPRMNGHTLVQRVRASDKATPLIMVTSEADRSRVIEAIRSGVNDFIIKPFSPETLLEKVRKVIEKCPRPISPSLETSRMNVLTGI